MALITNFSELQVPSTVKMMIYGQAGMGKSTLALSAPKCALFDFDGGVSRIKYPLRDLGAGVVQVNTWAKDVKEQLEQEAHQLDPYETIVVDTVGKMMDYITAYKCGTRQPQLRDWGNINAEFQWFTRTLSMMGKNIIFVAHRDVRKEGDNNVYVPSLREKNYNSIVTELDLLGYLEMRNDHGQETRTNTIDPTSRNDGKNTCGLPGVMNIPLVLDKNNRPIAPNNFITESIIKPFKGALQARQDEDRRYSEVMTEIGMAVDAITDADTANLFIANIDTYAHVGSSKAKAGAMLAAKAKSLGLVLDKKTKSYTGPKQEKENGDAA